MAITGHSQAEPRIMGKENEVTLYKRTFISDALGGVNSLGVSSIEIKELKLPITYVSGFLQGSFCKRQVGGTIYIKNILYIWGFQFGFSNLSTFYGC